MVEVDRLDFETFFVRATLRGVDAVKEGEVKGSSRFEVRKT
jgi:hypothetical protein